MARGKPGLTEQDLADLRAQLAEGKRPRVQLSGPHFPVETAGTVVRIGQPEADGPDFVRVRVRVNNMTDELAFAPGELRVRGRGKPAGTKAVGTKAAVAKAAGTKAAGTRAAGSGAAARPKADLTPGAASSGASSPSASSSGASSPSAAAPPSDAGGSASARESSARESSAQASAAQASAAPAKASRTPAASARATAAKDAPAGPARRRKATPTAPVTVTVASAGPAWTLTATRGAKHLVRNVPLPPGVVTALAELLDQPALSDAVSEINDVALAEAQARAEHLRAELDQLEAVLATHRAPRRR